MIAENLFRVGEKITEAARSAGRKPEEIKLVAVSKRFPATMIEEAVRCGQLNFGENYIQELQEKLGALPPQAKIHFIGHLQSNKAKVAAEHCEMVETVDSLKLAKKLANHLHGSSKRLQILIQVNIGNDPKKAGVHEDQVEELLNDLQDLNHLDIKGLMTMPPLETDQQNSRRYFAGLRELGERMKNKGLFPSKRTVELSMGMSQDYHIAIEEGATIIRIGTAIFGQRPPREIT